MAFYLIMNPHCVHHASSLERSSRRQSRIANGNKEKLILGDIGIQRDWGWSPEYVDAMWRMLQTDSPEDFVIATGESNSLEDFVATASQKWVWTGVSMSFKTPNYFVRRRSVIVAGTQRKHDVCWAGKPT